MKKFLILILLAVLLLSLVACSSEKPEEAPQPTELTVETEPQIERLPVVNVPEDMFGTCSWSLYYNSYTGLQYELPENWGFYSNSELAKRCGIAVAEDASPTNEDYAAALKANGICYDTIAFDNGSSDKVVLCFEHMGYLYGKTMTEQEFADMMLEQETSQLTGLDAGVTGATAGTQTIAGTDHPCIHSIVADDGQLLYRTQVFIQYDEFMLIISGMSRYEGNGATLLNGFKAYSGEG